MAWGLPPSVGAVVAELIWERGLRENSPPPVRPSAIFLKWGAVVRELGRGWGREGGREGGKEHSNQIIVSNLCIICG